MSSLERIIIYPIKSLDGLALSEVDVLPSGALSGDRRWAIFDAQEQIVNAKRTPRIHQVRAHFDEQATAVRLVADDQTYAGRIADPETAAWLSRFFGFPVTLREDAAAGWPDDTDAPGPTIVGHATLATVGYWFDRWSVDEVTRRFRPNLIAASDELFWEDRLYGPAGTGVRFKLGRVEFEGTNPCQRCAVPSREPDSGKVSSGFAREFSTRRESALPVWASRDRFDHFYRLCVNTRLADSCAGGRIRVGDSIAIAS